MPPKSYFEDLMYGRKRSLFWEGALFFLSVLYRAAIAARHALYRHHLVAERTLPCTVLSIGNITLGGTGKTPAVIHLAELLTSKGRQPVVISRGYGRKNEAEIVVVSDGKSVLADGRTGGDEPVLIASKCVTVPVVVGRDRYQAALAALARFDPDIVLLDDGFQHLRLRRTSDIVLVDARDPFGNGRLFPAGILREPVTALKRSQAVLITNAAAQEDTERLKETIRRHTNAAIFTSSQTALDLIECRTGEIKPLSILKGTTVLALSGIARPASFHSLLRALGAQVAADCTYPDHHQFTPADLSEIYRRAGDSRAGMIITTEKDAVRLRDLVAEGVWALRIELGVREQREWEAFIGKQI